MVDGSSLVTHVSVFPSTRVWSKSKTANSLDCCTYNKVLPDVNTSNILLNQKGDYVISIMPKIPEILVGNQMKQNIQSQENFKKKGPPLKEVHFDLSVQSV